jgi:hypothetical protein
MTVELIKETLRENQFGVDEGELEVIMRKLVQQQSAHGPIIDFRRFLTAVRPRVWYDILYAFHLYAALSDFLEQLLEFNPYAYISKGRAQQ